MRASFAAAVRNAIDVVARWEPGSCTGSEPQARGGMIGSALPESECPFWVKAPIRAARRRRLLSAMSGHNRRQRVGNASADPTPHLRRPALWRAIHAETPKLQLTQTLCLVDNPFFVSTHSPSELALLATEVLLGRSIAVGWIASCIAIPSSAWSMLPRVREHGAQWRRSKPEPEPAISAP